MTKPTKLFEERRKVLQALPAGRTISWYQEKTGWTYPVIRQALHDHGITFADTRGSHERAHGQEFRESLLPQLKEFAKEGLSLREAAKRLGRFSHERLRQICQQLDYKWPNPYPVKRQLRTAGQQELMKRAWDELPKLDKLFNQKDLAKHLGVPWKELARAADVCGQRPPSFPDLRAWRFEHHKEVWCGRCENWQPQANFYRHAPVTGARLGFEYCCKTCRNQINEQSRTRLAETTTG